MDKTFGVQLKEGEFFIGKDQIKINNDDIIIGDKLYRGTTGLRELITKNEPDATNIMMKIIKIIGKYL